MIHDQTRRSLIVAALVGASSIAAGVIFPAAAVAQTGAKKQENSMKTSVHFSSGGLRIAGELYVPADSGAGKRAAIIVGHPASGVKEQAAGLYAQRLAALGFITLAFDTATQGESEGQPRGVEDPARRIEELKDAVSYLSLRDDVDAQRIGVLGICASGGYVIPAAVTDHRIKAVATVSGVDLGSIYRQGADGRQDPAIVQHMLDAAATARTAEANGHGVAYFPIFETEEKARASGVFMAEGWDYYCTPRAQHPRSAKQFTLTSIDRIASTDGFQFAHLLSPRPLLVVVGRTAITAGNSMRSFENAQEPKETFWVDGASHVDLYDREQYVPQVVAKLAEFFTSHLG